jgi:helicase SWR1
LEKAIETGEVSTNENQQRVSKLHSLLRPHLLRRLKKDVEKELPKKYEHLVLCPLSKRQRFLYDEFMSRRQTSDDLGSGMYYRIANILMQLRKVCNHPDLFEVRPIVTSFAMSHAAISDFGVTERFIRSNFSPGSDKQTTSHLPAFLFIDRVNISQSQGVEPSFLPSEALMGPANEPHEPRDVRTIVGFKRHQDATARARAIARRMDMNHWNRLRCASSIPALSCETITRVRSLISALSPLASLDHRRCYFSTPHLVSAMVSTHSERLNRMTDIINHFAFATPPAVALDLPSIALAGYEDAILSNSSRQPELFDMLHRPAVKLQIAFPDASLLQYDCGKLQELHDLLRQRKAGGHRALIFTQMTKVLDILEAFLNLHGYLYLRLDGSTKIEDRQYITERFNSDSRIFCFISSSRSGGVGIK